MPLVNSKAFDCKRVFERDCHSCTCHRMKSSAKLQKSLDKVNEFDCIFAEQQLAKLDELVKARFVEMFGDSSSQYQ